MKTYGEAAQTMKGIHELYGIECHRFCPQSVPGDNQIQHFSVRVRATLEPGNVWKIDLYVLLHIGHTCISSLTTRTQPAHLLVVALWAIVLVALLAGATNIVITLLHFAELLVALLVIVRLLVALVCVIGILLGCIQFGAIALLGHAILISVFLSIGPGFGVVLGFSFVSVLVFMDALVLACAI